jgi:hypothetical protein
VADWFEPLDPASRATVDGAAQPASAAMTITQNARPALMRW